MGAFWSAMYNRAIVKVRKPLVLSRRKAKMEVLWETARLVYGEK